MTCFVSHSKSYREHTHISLCFSSYWFSATHNADENHRRYRCAVPSYSISGPAEIEGPAHLQHCWITESTVSCRVIVFLDHQQRLFWHRCKKDHFVTSWSINFQSNKYLFYFWHFAGCTVCHRFCSTYKGRSLPKKTLLKVLETS